MRTEYKEITKLNNENNELKNKLIRQAKQLLRLEMENAELKDVIEELGGNDRISGLNKTNVESIRTDEWRIEQFNRNRAPEDQVHSIQEMSDRVEELFGEKVNPSAVDGW